MIGLYQAEKLQNVLKYSCFKKDCPISHYLGGLVGRTASLPLRFWPVVLMFFTPDLDHCCVLDLHKALLMVD